VSEIRILTFTDSLLTGVSEERLGLLKIVLLLISAIKLVATKSVGKNSLLIVWEFIKNDERNKRRKDISNFFEPLNFFKEILIIYSPSKLK